MSNKDRRYTFSISRGGQGPTEEYEKKESELTNAEIHLLAGELLHRIDTSPKQVKEAVQWEIYKRTQNK